jgi:hypothetical protein
LKEISVVEEKIESLIAAKTRMSPEHVERNLIRTNGNG